MKKKKSKVTIVEQYAECAEIGDMYTSRWRKLDLLIPSNFRMLCAILQVKPEKVLMNFMWTLCYSHKDAEEKQIKSAQQFFLSCRYGEPSYSKKDIKQLFKELKAVRTVYNTTEKMEMQDKELFWKSNHMYIEFWFKRWFEKNTRKGDVSVLEEY